MHINNNTQAPSFNALIMPSKEKIAKVAGDTVANSVYHIKPQLEHLAKDADIYILPFSTPNKPVKNGLWISVDDINNNSIKKKIIGLKKTISAKLDCIDGFFPDFMIAGTYANGYTTAESMISYNLLGVATKHVSSFLHSKEPTYIKPAIKYYN